MYTGYWIQANFIFGPKESGKFWIGNGLGVIKRFFVTL